MKNKIYTLCVDLGTQETKFTLLVNDNDKSILNLPKFSTVPSIYKKEESSQAISNFLRLLSTKYLDYVKKCDFYGNNISKSESGFVKLEYLDRNYYPEELVAKLLETIKYRIEDELDAEGFVENIILTKNIPVVTAISGLNLNFCIPEEKAILCAYKQISESKQINHNLLAIDLGASGIKLHYYEELKYIKSIRFTDWSANEFTTNFRNLSIQQRLKETQGLSDDEKKADFLITFKEYFNSLTTEEIFEIFTNNEDYKDCIKQVINRMIYRIKQVKNDTDIKSIDKVILLGGAAKLPLVQEVIQKCLKIAIYDIKIDPVYFITYGLYLYCKTKVE